MSILDSLHERHIRQRRVDVLTRHLASVMPEGSRVLDIGCGDGMIAATLMQQRPDLSIRGLDVKVRPETAIPVEPFDGQTIPAADGAYDIVSFVDVLHHVPEPMPLLQEAVRVAGTGLVIKDHLREGLAANSTLTFMDNIGNRRHGIPVPALYASHAEWKERFDEIGVTPAVWVEKLGLYPWPLSCLFDRQLHFVARLEKEG